MFHFVYPYCQMLMPLSKYNQKRNFEETLEPKGKIGKSANELLFVVQKHAASHLHYDFKLELNGVLLSWVVPKGIHGHDSHNVF